MILPDYVKVKSDSMSECWEDFQNAGMLWLVNHILHIFGWAICVERDPETNEFITVFPLRVKFRGFASDIETEGYAKVTNYLKEEIDSLVEETQDNPVKISGTYQTISLQNYDPNT